jgi:orf78
MIKIRTSDVFLDKCKDLVKDYTIEHLDKSDATPEFDVFIVWYAKELQNFKALLSTTLYDGMYYELTYDGDNDLIYLDAYKKFENRVIK